MENKVLLWEVSPSPVWDKTAILGLNFPCFGELHGPLGRTVLKPKYITVSHSYLAGVKCCLTVMGNILLCFLQ